jgi:hypothetical protein
MAVNAVGSGLVGLETSAKLFDVEGAARGWLMLFIYCMIDSIQVILFQNGSRLVSEQSRCQMVVGSIEIQLLIMCRFYRLILPFTVI